MYMSIPGEGPIWMDNFQCSGDEESIVDCVRMQPWGEATCGHSQDAGVYCQVVPID